MMRLSPVRVTDTGRSIHFSDAIDAIANAVPDDFSSLSEVLSPELIDTCLKQAPLTRTGVA